MRDGMDLEAILGELGEDLEGEDLMGARGRRRIGVLQTMRNANVAPGVPATGGRRQYLGVGTASWPAGTAANTVVRLTVEPQRPFLPNKLVIDAIKSVGAVAVGVEITSIQVGTASQSVATAAAPAALFAPQVQGNNVAFDLAQPGVAITIELRNTAAIPVGESVSASVGFLGDTLV